ncbi:hypothetical protein NY40_0525 [Helicobacter pylori NY40]|uniref:Uncharacterized protein n=1 Tax=Helicobacter pylori NY40 TaxID=1426844 RepID=A0A060PPY1_HELPX|nr:hypothetical protein NY40_0525 [Helicobacter pylori NY40]
MRRLLGIESAKFNTKELKERTNIMKDNGALELLILGDKLSVTPFKDGELEVVYLWNKSSGIYKSELKPFKNGACPFIVAKLYTDELNHYYGLFRDIKPMQDFINYAENRMGNMMGNTPPLTHHP